MKPEDRVRSSAANHRYALEQAALARADLERELRAAHEQGVRITRLAKLSGLTRPTVYRVLEAA